MELLKAILGLVIFGAAVVGIRIAMDKALTLVKAKSKAKANCEKDCGCG